VPFTVPPLAPVLAGIPLVLQGYLPGKLSNPATLPLDQAYFVPAAADVLQAQSPQTSAHFSDKFAFGDFDDDGSIDIAVGAWWEKVGGMEKAGAVHVFWGPGMTTSTVLTSPTPKPWHLFGQGMSAADLDGDSVADLIVGEGGGSPAPAGGKGRLHVYAGSGSFPGLPAHSIESLWTGPGVEVYGRILQSADLNGDGDPDLIAGVPYSAQGGLLDSGHVEVFYGPTFQHGVVVDSPDPAESDFFGDSLGVGDINGDGIADVLEASGREDAGGVKNVGRMHAFDGPTLQHVFTLENPLSDGPNSRFGNVVLGIDTDGDGLAEVVVTDQRDHVFIFGSPAYSDDSLIRRSPDPGSNGGASASFGYFATAGDVNGDGLVDIVVGEPYGAGVGRVHVALGPYWATTHVLMDKLPEAGAHFGWGVGLCDIDQDGRDELAVGSELGSAGATPGAGHLAVFDLDG
jgi:hypothetical protein